MCHNTLRRQSDPTPEETASFQRQGIWRNQPIREAVDYARSIMWGLYFVDLAHRVAHPSYCASMAKLIHCGQMVGVACIDNSVKQSLCYV